MKILKESDKAIVKTIEQKIKNKWSWKWTSEKVSRDIPRVGPVSYTCTWESVLLQVLLIAPGVTIQFHMVEMEKNTLSHIAILANMLKRLK